jgi:hypothetical protein
MNGPQLKAVLERAYRNYYYYKYVPGYGGYSYYTTCMLDTDASGKIMYRDASPTMPTGDDVVALTIDGVPVDFSDADTYYRVSTVNYLAAGACNFSDAGHTLWPLDQIVADTQYYVRDAVIEYIQAMGTVSPAIEGRLVFLDEDSPVVTISAPVDGSAYLHPDLMTLDFEATDASGVASITAMLDGTAVADGRVVDLLALPLGSHVLVVTAVDHYGNVGAASATFDVIATVGSLKATVERLYAEGKITKPGTRDSLIAKLDLAQDQLDAGQVSAAKSTLNAFINQVKAQSGKSIKPKAATLLVTDARWVIAHPG